MGSTTNSRVHGQSGLPGLAEDADMGQGATYSRWEAT